METLGFMQLWTRQGLVCSSHRCVVLLRVIAASLQVTTLLQQLTTRSLLTVVKSCIAEVTRARLQHQTRHCLPTGDTPTDAE